MLPETGDDEGSKRRTHLRRFVCEESWESLTTLTLGSADYQQVVVGSLSTTLVRAGGIQ